MTRNITTAGALESPTVHVIGPVQGTTTTRPICRRCGATSSVFWHRIAYGPDIEGNGGVPVDLCDNCAISFTDWLVNKCAVNKCACCKGTAVKEPWDP